jgi:nucleolar protein 12
MASYVPGAIGSVLHVEKADDSLFSNVPSDRFKAKIVVQAPTETRKRPIKEKADDHISREKQPKKVREAKHEEEDSDEGENDVQKDIEASHESEDESDEKAERTVFVGNLPLKPKSVDEEAESDGTKSAKLMKRLEKAVRKEFAKYGKVESVRLRSIGLKSVKVPTGSDFRVVRKVAVAKGSLDERVETCNAYVVFESAESVGTAVEKANGLEFLGNHIRVDAVHDGSKGKVFDRKRSVFVGNLVFEASEEECWKHFADVMGDKAVKSVRIIKDPATNLGRGFAYVLLNDEDAVEQAIEKLNGTKLRKRPIRVTHCERSSAKKDGKLALKFKEAKSDRKDFAGKQASDPEDASITRRKKAILAQKAASSHKKKKVMGAGKKA